MKLRWLISQNKHGNNSEPVLQFFDGDETAFNGDPPHHSNMWTDIDIVLYKELKDTYTKLSY